MRIAVCDDEKACRDIIVGHIQGIELNGLTMDITEFSSGEELISAFHNGASFDFLFLDIQMGDINGIQAANEIRSKNKNTVIFFISGFTNYVSCAFALNAFQFLIKPIRIDVLDNEFRRALKKYLMERVKYTIELSNSDVVCLEIKDITYVESSDHHIVVHTEKGKYIKRERLNDTEKFLAPYGFVRTHQSFLVNMAHIFEITQKDIILKNNTCVMVSRRKRQDVICCFNKFMAGCFLC
ncbi:MAG: LytTR family DNA-binding domain-containing protein [Oscillospiraceae bacterium]|nr:LytTR family DNA-binding domain-containing protein [Oscillospiraceae bacterium]